MVHVYYLFASEVRRANEWRKYKLKAPDGKPVDTWEHVRYLLEAQLGMYKESARYSTSSFVHAMTSEVFKLCKYKYDANHRLRAADRVPTGASLILFRRPPPPYFTRYIPTRFTAKGDSEDDDEHPVHSEQVQLEGETEDAQLQKLTQVTADSVQQQLSTLYKAKSRKDKALERRHPDDYEYSASKKPIPHEAYLCKACGKTGTHFRNDCPLHVDEQDANVSDKVKAADKIFVPSGIPKTFLQSVQQDVELNKQTMVTRDGQFVQLQRNIPKLTEEEADLSVVPTWQEKENEDGGELYFDFEDYLTQVADVREERLKAKYGPKKKIQFMCTHWLQGLCHKGVLCEYLHYYDVKFIPICKFFMEGKCTNAACTYQHTLPSSITQRQEPCNDYAIGFCPQGPLCDKSHQRRAAPCIADFADPHVFHACVQAFEEFMETHRAADVQAKKRYQRAPEVTKSLYERLQKNARHK